MQKVTLRVKMGNLRMDDLMQFSSAAGEAGGWMAFKITKVVVGDLWLASLYIRGF
jgi:hypothetical protein